MSTSKRLTAASLLLALASVLASAFVVPAIAYGATTAVQTTTKAAPATDANAGSAARLDINTATAAQLKALPGIGDAYAARIIAGRPYTMKTQLSTRGILPKATYSAIADKIIASRPKK